MIAAMAQVRNNHFLLQSEDEHGTRTVHVLTAEMEPVGTYENYGDALKATHDTTEGE